MELVCDNGFGAQELAHQCMGSLVVVDQVHPVTDEFLVDSKLASVRLRRGYFSGR